MTKPTKWLCSQQRLSSAWASTQSDQSLRCPHEERLCMTLGPAKTQISLGIHPVWSESSLCTQWVAKDPTFLHADSEDSDQTGRMPRLIWVFAGRTVILLVLSWWGSYLYRNHKLNKKCLYHTRVTILALDTFLCQKYYYRQLNNGQNIDILWLNTVKLEIFTSSNFRGISQSVSIREKLKSANYFPVFETISIVELLVYMVAVCGSYLLNCGKTRNMQLSKNSLSLQAIWLEVNWSMNHPIYSMSRWLIFFCCCIWHTFNCFSFLLNRMFAFMLHSEYITSCFMAKSVVWHDFQGSSHKQAGQMFHCFVLTVIFFQPSEWKYVLFVCFKYLLFLAFQTL